MKKIVSNVLIVSTQLIVGGLFLFMLFSNKHENNRVVVIENNNLDKMADAVSELFVVDHAVVEATDTKKEEELVDAEQKRAEEEARAKAEAEAQAAAEALAQAQAEEAARIAQEEAARRAQEEAARNAESASYDNSVASLQSYAHDLVIGTYGWSEADFEALVILWNKESGWNYSASNGSAYGIPQALPGSKMAVDGDDYRTNGRTQIRWGLRYIQSTYGTPSNAWIHFQNYNWY